MMVQTARRLVWSEGFLALPAPFFALRPAGRKCPFFSPRALPGVSARGLRGCGLGVAGSCTPRVTRHQHRSQGLHNSCSDDVDMDALLNDRVQNNHDLWTGVIRRPQTHLQEPGTQCCGLDDGDSVPELSGARPAPLVEVRPQGRVQRHTVEHVVDVSRFLQILDVLAPQMGGTDWWKQGNRSAQDLTRQNLAAICGLASSAEGGTVGGSVDCCVSFLSGAAVCRAERGHSSSWHSWFPGPWSCSRFFTQDKRTVADRGAFQRTVEQIVDIPVVEVLSCLRSSSRTLTCQFMVVRCMHGLRFIAPVVEYISPAPAVFQASAPVVEYFSPAPAVFQAPAPVVEYPVPAPAVS